MRRTAERSRLPPPLPPHPATSCCSAATSAATSSAEPRAWLEQGAVGASARLSPAGSASLPAARACVDRIGSIVSLSAARSAASARASTASRGKGSAPYGSPGCQRPDAGRTTKRHAMRCDSPPMPPLRICWFQMK
eukprot:350380-Chlamydomonas_euryale.AAC.9